MCKIFKKIEKDSLKVYIYIYKRESKTFKNIDKMWKEIFKNRKHYKLII